MENYSYKNGKQTIYVFENREYKSLLAVAQEVQNAYKLSINDTIKLIGTWPKNIKNNGETMPYFTDITSLNSLKAQIHKRSVTIQSSNL